MALDVSRLDIWIGRLKDEPGALARRLAALADSGANLEFVLGRRRPERRGAAVVFIAPIRGAKQAAAAKEAGFRQAKRLAALRIAGQDKPGAGAKMTAALAEAGINLRGLSAAVIGKRFVVHVALDKAADAARAARILRAL